MPKVNFAQQNWRVESRSPFFYEFFEYEIFVLDRIISFSFIQFIVISLCELISKPNGTKGAKNEPNITTQPIFLIWRLTHKILHTIRYAIRYELRYDTEHNTQNVYVCDLDLLLINSPVNLLWLEPLIRFWKPINIFIFSCHRFNFSWFSSFNFRQWMNDYVVLLKSNAYPSLRLWLFIWLIFLYGQTSAT